MTNLNSSHSLVVIDASKDQPIGGINIPLYEMTPDKRTKIRKLLNEPEKVSYNYISWLLLARNTIAVILLLYVSDT